MDVLLTDLVAHLQDKGVADITMRIRCPGFCATRETAGIVKCPSVDV
jgi:hypothetical protein